MADSYAAELSQVQSHLNAEASRVLELKEEVHVKKGELQTEKHMVKALEAELLKERRTINEVLDQMQVIELEARAAAEQARQRENVVQGEKEALQKELDDERAMRLQHMYMITRSRAEADKAAKDENVSPHLPCRLLRFLNLSLELVDLSRLGLELVFELGDRDAPLTDACGPPSLGPGTPPPVTPPRVFAGPSAPDPRA